MKNYMLAAAVAAGALCSAGPALAQIPTGAELVAQMDKDNDNAVNKQEWEASGNPYPYPEEADTNKDGTVNAAELDAFLAQFGGGGGAPPQTPNAPATPGDAPAQK